MNVFGAWGFDVWTLDHEGYGRSSRTDGNSDIASGVEDLKAAAEVVARATGRTRLHFYGGSSGALRAGAFAMARPERVDRLILEAFTFTGKGCPTPIDSSSCWPAPRMRSRWATPATSSGTSCAHFWKCPRATATPPEEAVMGLLSDRELASLLPAETHAFAGPIPTQSVSSDEFMPAAQTPRQRRVEVRLKELGGALAKRHGLTRRRFLATASGMAAAFLAMNEVYGALYDVSTAEAQTPEVAKERADGLSRQFIMDCHTHFLRDDTRIMGFVRQREAVGKAGWNPALRGKEQTIEDLKFANYYKEVYLDSDTKVALISGAPSEIPQDWFLTNEMKAEARARVNREAGSRRMLSHAIFTPGYAGWMEQVDHAIRD